MKRSAILGFSIRRMATQLAKINVAACTLAVKTWSFPVFSSVARKKLKHPATIQVNLRVATATDCRGFNVKSEIE